MKLWKKMVNAINFQFYLIKKKKGFSVLDEKMDPMMDDEDQLESPKDEQGISNSLFLFILFIFL